MGEIAARFGASYGELRELEEDGTPLRIRDM